MCNDVFFCDTTLDLRLWACAMMINFLWYYIYTEALGMCNDDKFSVILHLCWDFRHVQWGVRTDKGFKEVHLNKVAKALQEFCGHEVSDTQVYNHLRKWRQRWVKLSKLRDLSGAQWDEDNCMIVLEEHYNGHTKVSKNLWHYNLIC